MYLRLSSRYASGWFMSLLSSALLVVFVGPSAPARAVAAEPAITITPAVVSCADSLTIHGEGFIPGSDVAVSVGGIEEIPRTVFDPHWGPAPVTDDGTFVLTGIKPLLNECIGLAPEPHMLTASTATGDSLDNAFAAPTATASFAVSPNPADPRLTLSPDHGFGCIDVTARGENFEPGTIVTIFVSAFPSHTAISPGEAEVAADGTFSFDMPKRVTQFITCEGDFQPRDGQRYLVSASTGQSKVGNGLREPSAARIFTVTLPPVERFHQTWARTDQPVAVGDVARTWIWGPGPFTDVISEEYEDSPDGSRDVQYYDKARMEISHPDADRLDPWYVTNGLLVVEMIEGRIQIGDGAFGQTLQPADIPIAGDLDMPQDDAAWSITYADINEFALRSQPARQVGELIWEYVDAEGEIRTSDPYGDFGVIAAHYVPETDHAIASVFWEFMNDEGIVFFPGGQVQDTGTDRLFPNPFYATGFPITEAYWLTALVGGEPTDVLWQCFERRCLTYTPTNEPGWQVEAGNVGQHYWRWRYGS